MKNIKSLTIIACICLMVFSVKAQRTKRKAPFEKYWTVGLSLNAINYYGDLNPLKQYISTELKFTKPNIGLEVSRKLSSRFSLRGSFHYGRLKGDDFEAANPDKEEHIGRYGRNLHFRNDIFELGVMGIFDLFPSRGRFYRRRYFTPYISAGIAGYFHNPKAKVPESFSGSEAGSWVALRPLHTEGQGLPGYAKEYSQWQLAIPMGAGVKWRVSDRLDLAFEVGWRILFTDHIDDVGARYPDIRDLESDLAKVMFDRSAETTAAAAGEVRDITQVTEVVGGVSSQYGSLDDINNLEEIPGFQRLASYGIKGQIRGNGVSDNDLYSVTGFRLTYILTTKRYPRYNPNSNIKRR